MKETNIVTQDVWMEQFILEQKIAQEQADKNEEILDELCEEWKKYPNGKPIIKQLFKQIKI